MLMQKFDVVVEASGSSQGIRLAAALTRPLGTIVLKSTCSTVGDADAPSFAAIANDIVVQELTLVGSRCALHTSQPDDTMAAAFSLDPACRDTCEITSDCVVQVFGRPVPEEASNTCRAGGD